MELVARAGRARATVPGWSRDRVGTSWLARCSGPDGGSITDGARRGGSGAGTELGDPAGPGTDPADPAGPGTDLDPAHPDLDPAHRCDRSAAALCPAEHRGGRGVTAFVDRSDSARQPPDDGQRDALSLRQPQVRRAPRPAVLPLDRCPAGAPGHRDPGGQPVAGCVRDGSCSRGGRSGGHHPGRRGRGGRGRGGRHAGRRRPDRPPVRPGSPRPELHGRHRPDRQQRDVHRGCVAVPAARRGGRHRPVGLRDGRLRPLREPRRVLADHQLRLGGRPRRLRLPGLLPRRPRDDLGHPVRRGLQAAGAIPRPGRSRASSWQADHGCQGRSE